MKSETCDACSTKYYLTDSEEGSGKSRTWGIVEESEQDKCTADPDGREDACCECPEGAECGMQTTLKSLAIQKGYYRHSPLSARTYICPDELACAGSPKNDTDKRTRIVDESVSVEEGERRNYRIKGDELCRVGFEVSK